MPKVCVIADDLTGANAVGALITKKGFKTLSISWDTLLEQSVNLQRFYEYQALVISTNSRYIEKEEAYERVLKISQVLKKLDCELVAKRIDTTLRGNIGGEIDALLDAINSEHLAIVVPSYPSAGRICIGGHILVNSVPLNETEVIRDSKFPYNTSKVAEILKLQSKREIVHIPYDEVQSSEEHITKILSLLPKGSIIVVDAVTDRDIQKIAKACISSGVPFVPVDPGPFTAEVISKRFTLKVEEPRILLVIGSITELTRKQVKYLLSSYPVKLVKLDVRKVLEGNLDIEVKQIMEEVIKALNDFHIVGVITALEDTDIVSVQKLGYSLSERYISEKINDFIGLVTLKILETRKDFIRGLYVSGGDTLEAIIKHLGAIGINVKDEVYPLTVFGTLIGGKFEGLFIITKGGLVGVEDTLKLCVDYLIRTFKLS